MFNVRNGLGIGYLIWGFVVLLFKLNEERLIGYILFKNHSIDNAIFYVITFFIESIHFSRHTKARFIYLNIIYFIWYFVLYLLIQDL